MKTILHEKYTSYFLRYNKVLHKKIRFQCAAKRFNKAQQTEQ